jgi:hypothetical protein
MQQSCAFEAPSGEVRDARVGFVAKKGRALYHEDFV